MNVFEYAKQMETDGRDFYLEIAEKAPATGVKNILQLLADEELNHYNIFEAMEQGRPSESLKRIDFENVKNIYSKMKDSGESLDFGNEQLDYYKKALSIEEDSVTFYTNEAQKTDNATLKDQLLKIADEEKRHVHIVDTLFEFVRRPKQWLENAEWSHVGEQY